MTLQIDEDNLSTILSRNWIISDKDISQLLKIDDKGDNLQLLHQMICQIEKQKAFGLDFMNSPLGRIYFRSKETDLFAFEKYFTPRTKLKYNGANLSPMESRVVLCLLINEQLHPGSYMMHDHLIKAVLYYPKIPLEDTKEGDKDRISFLVSQIRKKANINDLIQTSQFFGYRINSSLSYGFRA